MGLCRWSGASGYDAGVVTTLAVAIVGSMGVYAMTAISMVDFTSPEEQSRWVVVNDGVMGGLSDSRIRVLADSTAVFEGRLSLENNGGFASVRRLPADYELSDAEGIVLQVKGDGRKYQFRVRTDDRTDGAAYRVIFDTKPEGWITLRLPFAEFQCTFRGRAIPDAPPLAPSGIRQIGFLIADKRPGPFHLQVRDISAWRKGSIDGDE